MPQSGEIVLAPPSPIVPARHARSTVMIGSIGVLRAQGHFEQYASHLPALHRELLVDAVAGTWIPLDVAMSHYLACDALGLSPDMQAANGRATFDKTSGTLMGTMIRMAKEAGVSPWTVFPHFQRFWERAYDGGGVTILKTGPKEARLDLVEVGLLDSRYYRNACRGLVTAVVELFCRKAYLTERSHARGAVVWRIQWA